MSQKRAIVASYGVPEPDRDTGSRRVLDLVRLLQGGGWTVSFVALNGIARTHYAAELQQLGVAVFGRNSQEPLGASTGLEAALALGACDLCVFAFWPVAERLMPVIRELSPRTRIIVDSIDLHLLRDARGILQPSPAGVPAGALGDSYAAQFTGELNTYAAADAVLTVSAKEAALINDLTAQPGLAHAIGLIEDQAASRKPFKQRGGILTVGNYAHLPNVQAVEYLCRDILPKIDAPLLAANPVYVVGANLDDNVKRLGATSPHVKLVGFVPCMRPYLEQCRIAVVPLLYGAGAKGKVVEALMAGTPTVSTPIGIEGLALEDRQHLLVADTAEAFAIAMTTLLSDEKQWKALARQGRTRALAEHGRATIARQFTDVIDRVLALDPKPAILAITAPAVYQGRLQYQDNQRVAARLRGAIEAAVPKEGLCAVITAGEEWLLQIANQSMVRFPDPSERAQAQQRTWGEIGLEDLRELRASGIQFVIVPARASWWLDRAAELKRHLAASHNVALKNDVCVIYDIASDRAPSVETAPAITTPTPAHRDAVDASNVRMIAFYLPQFHPIPENDAWWGRGFTEWTNVSKARPLFPGHVQPAQPTELGYYDLRLADARDAQAALAQAHGIHGFCYYHYWFNGKRLLERPFDEVLSSGQPDFPFCLCWANEPWSRRWDGSSHDVLQPQQYSAEDDEAHIEWLLPALRDRRAITVNGKPLLLIYQARDLPDPARTVALWKRRALDAGLGGLHLVAVETGWDAGWDATQVGFDAKLLFQPQFSILRTVPKISTPGKDALQVYDYRSAWPTLANPEPVGYPRYDTVFPCWDNSPRAGDRAVVVHGSTPAAYEEWLGLAISRAARRAPQEQLVFLNAWNEWAEGCQLEPSLAHGRAYLEATRSALTRAIAASPQRNVRLAKRAPGRTPDVSMLDVVIAFYESDERELKYCNSRVLGSKEFQFEKLSDVLVFTQTIDGDLFPCDRVEMTCVLLSPFASTLSMVVTDPQTRQIVAAGQTELRYDSGPGLITVKMSLDNQNPPVARALELTISCTPTGRPDDSFNLVLQTTAAGERMSAMRMFRRTPGYSRSMLDRCVNSIKACGVADDAIHIVNKKQSAAANRNEGFRRTTRPFVCYADDDVEIIDPDTFPKLLRMMNETGAAVIGPRLTTNIGTIFCADPYFDEHQHPKPRGFGEPVTAAYRYVREVPWLPSTLIICDRDAVDAIGGFGEDYIGSQMEDVDFCLKVRDLDLTCVYDGTVDVVHYNYQRNDHFRENFDRFAARWKNHPHLLDPRELQPPRYPDAGKSRKPAAAGKPRRAQITRS
jgi:hypothetical protein